MGYGIGVYWHSSSYVADAYQQGGTNTLNGLRPVLKLASTVKVTGGTGTYTDPYQISN